MFHPLLRENFPVKHKSAFSSQRHIFKEIACVVKTKIVIIWFFQSIPSVSLRSTSLSYEKIIFLQKSCRESLKENVSTIGKCRELACVLFLVIVRKFSTADIRERANVLCMIVSLCVFPWEKNFTPCERLRRKKCSQKRPKIKNVYAERKERRHLDIFCVLYL